MPLATRRSRLRESTSHAHASLDRSIGPFRSVADYGRYALALCAFRIPLEEKLAAIDRPDAFAEWRPQLIGHALRADLLDLRLTSSIDTDGPALPQNIESLLGALYVLEGSALGATILFRRAQAIGLSEIYGARHLALHSSLSDNWRKFLIVLEQGTAIEFESVVTASNAIFHAAERAFTGFRDVDPQPA
jgi:heme oxygenase (biliverdin-IX-beta and delta-forming)